MLTDTFVALDVETSGLSPEEDRITRVVALRAVGGRIAEHYESLARSGTWVPESVSQVSGISNEMLTHAPLIGDVIRGLRRFVGFAPVAVYSDGFSWKFYLRELARLKLGSPVQQPLSVSRLARRLVPYLPQYTQAGVGLHFGLITEPVPGASRAGLELTVAILQALAELAASRGLSPLSMASLAELAGPPTTSEY